jgi:hypothetical protein
MRRNRDRTEFGLFHGPHVLWGDMKRVLEAPHMPIRRTCVLSLPTATKRKVLKKRHKSEEFLEKPVASGFVSFPLGAQQGYNKDIANKRSSLPRRFHHILGNFDYDFGIHQWPWASGSSSAGGPQMIIKITVLGHRSFLKMATKYLVTPASGSFKNS